MPISIAFLGALSSSAAATLYLKLDASNDPVTGELEINPSSGDTAIVSKKDVKITQGQKLILDA